MPKTLFLVDDDFDIRTMCHRLFSKRFGDAVEIRAFENGLEALEAAVTSGFPDVILTDDMMPLMTGTELAVELRKRGYAGKILMLSGTANDDVLAQGVDQRFMKPFSTVTLRDAVAAALAD